MTRQPRSWFPLELPLAPGMTWAAEAVRAKPRQSATAVATNDERRRWVTLDPPVLRCIPVRHYRPETGDRTESGFLRANRPGE
jgi:hypothetical protein